MRKARLTMILGLARVRGSRRAGSCRAKEGHVDQYTCIRCPAGITAASAASLAMRGKRAPRRRVSPAHEHPLARFSERNFSPARIRPRRLSGRRAADASVSHPLARVAHASCRDDHKAHRQHCAVALRRARRAAGFFQEGFETIRTGLPRRPARPGFAQDTPRLPRLRRRPELTCDLINRVIDVMQFDGWHPYES